MSPEIAKLIDNIKTQRESSGRAVDAATKKVAESDQRSRAILLELDESSAETDEAVRVLERAGLLKP